MQNEVSKVFPCGCRAFFDKDTDRPIKQVMCSTHFGFYKSDGEFRPITAKVKLYARTNTTRQE